MHYFWGMSMLFLAFYQFGTRVLWSSFFKQILENPGISAGIYDRFYLLLPIILTSLSFGPLFLLYRFIKGSRPSILVLLIFLTSLIAVTGWFAPDKSNFGLSISFIFQGLATFCLFILLCYAFLNTMKTHTIGVVLIFIVLSLFPWLTLFMKPALNALSDVSFLDLFWPLAGVETLILIVLILFFMRKGEYVEVEKKPSKELLLTPVDKWMLASVAAVSMNKYVLSTKWIFNKGREILINFGEVPLLLLMLSVAGGLFLFYRSYMSKPVEDLEQDIRDYGPWAFLGLLGGSFACVGLGYLIDINSVFTSLSIVFCKGINNLFWVFALYYFGRKYQGAALFKRICFLCVIGSLTQITMLPITISLIIDTLGFSHDAYFYVSRSMAFCFMLGGIWWGTRALCKK